MVVSSYLLLDKSSDRKFCHLDPVKNKIKYVWLFDGGELCFTKEMQQLRMCVGTYM